MTWKDAIQLAALVVPAVGLVAWAILTLHGDKRWAMKATEGKVETLGEELAHHETRLVVVENHGATLERISTTLGDMREQLARMEERGKQRRRVDE